MTPDDAPPTDPRAPLTAPAAPPPARDTPARDNSSNTKWLVVGACALAFMLLFRDPLSNVLNHTGHVVVSHDGKGEFKAELITTQTALGPTLVSSTAVPTASVSQPDGIQGARFISRKYGFQMAWPAGAGWAASDTVGAEFLARAGATNSQFLAQGVASPLVISKTTPVEGITPNVNVMTQPSNGTTIGAVIRTMAAQFQQVGATVETQVVDAATDSALVGITYPGGDGPATYQLQRVVISHGRVFWITATQIPPQDDLTQSLKDELRGILDSFQPLI